MSAQLRAPTSHRRHRDTPPRTQPVGDGKVVALRLVGGGIILWGLLSVIGVLVTHVAPGRWLSWDRGTDAWLAAHRTGFWNTLTLYGSDAANTPTVIAAAVALVILLRWRLHRWYESCIVIAAITGELLIFLGVTATVHRPRPPVPRLDQAPPTSSFPSGHTAAATALYGCLAILLLWIYGRRPAIRIAALVLCCAPLIVGLSRLYRGMHYPTDVLVGALGGGLWLLLVITTLLPRKGAEHPAGDVGGQHHPPAADATTGNPPDAPDHLTRS